MQAHELETLASFCNQIETSIGIFFDDCHNLRSASDLGQALLQSSHYAEDSLLRKALPDHFFVTGLENVQRQWSAGKQNGVERKQRNEGVQEVSSAGGEVRAKPVVQLL